ncbi:MAG: hypothetical protein PHU32_04135 [Candidatus ainarchaeum sp.]|nr:hypothetical protein [Candidatus ainarchaeum sp.]
MSDNQITINNLINESKFKNRLDNDVANFITDLKEHQNLRDLYNHINKNLNIEGDQIFPLTIRINDGYIRSKDLKTYYCNSELYKYFFLGICLELETPVSLILWIGSEDKLNEKNISTYKEICSKLNSEDIENIIISDKYLLGDKSKKNYSHILTFKSQINFIAEENKFFSNWIYFPFLKRSAEVFMSYFSPKFSPNQFDSDKQNYYVNYFVSVIKYNYSTGQNSINLSILNGLNTYYQNVKVSLENSDLIRELQENNGKWGFALFKDVTYKKNKLIREIILEKVNFDIIPEDILCHNIILRAYYNYLLTGDLYISSESKLKEIYINLANGLSHLKLDIMKNYSEFYEIYLKWFFSNQNSEIYYKPYLLNKYDSRYLPEIYESYALELNGKDIPINLLNWDNKTTLPLIFIYIYNKHSKRTLIDRLRRCDNKWLINT